MSVPTEYRRQNWEFNMTKNCNDCPNKEWLGDKTDKNLPPCNKCERKNEE